MHNGEYVFCHRFTSLNEVDRDFSRDVITLNTVKALLSQQKQNHLCRASDIRQLAVRHKVAQQISQTSHWQDCREGQSAHTFRRSLCAVFLPCCQSTFSMWSCNSWFLTVSAALSSINLPCSLMCFLQVLQSIQTSASADCVYAQENALYNLQAYSGIGPL